jgi:hypothetical protein
MANFTALRSRPNPYTPYRGECRKWVRHPAAPDTICLLTIDGSVKVLAVKVLTVSLSGLSLLTDIRLPHGKTLAVEIHHGPRKFACQREARVTYLMRTLEGNYVTGLAFDRDLNTLEIDKMM